MHVTTTIPTLASSTARRDPEKGLGVTPQGVAMETLGMESRQSAGGGGVGVDIPAWGPGKVRSRLGVTRSGQEWPVGAL